MIVPDCRTDDYYNEDFLDGKNKEFVRGFDWAIEMVLDNIFDNLDTIIENDYVMHLMDEKLPEHLQDEYEYEFTFGDRKSETRKIDTYGAYIRSKFLDRAESERDELITSMIDGMEESLYNAIRNKVLKDNEKAAAPKEYYDSRKHAFTGQKVSDGPVEETEE